MNLEALRSEALLHAGKARTMAAKLFNDPQASQVDAGDLLISMAQLVDLLCVAATPAPAPEPWGWAIVDKNGDEMLTRPRLREFFGATNHEHQPFSERELANANREWPGLAPFSIVTLYTAPRAATPAHAPQPLTDEQKGNEWRLLLPLSERFTSADWFEAGACFAEQHHGIGQGAATPAPAPHPDTADAERYRWLREKGFAFADVSLGTDYEGEDYVSYRIGFHLPEPAHNRYENDEWGAEDIDAAIDAARAGQGKEASNG